MYAIRSYYETEIIRSENGVEAIVDGRKYDLESSTPEPNVWLLKLDTEVVEFTVVAKDGGGYELVTSDASFSVSVSDPRKLGSSTDGAAGADGLVEIRTQMPGKVVRVLVSSGDPVSKGDGLVVVEAMKMRNNFV